MLIWETGQTRQNFEITIYVLNAKTSGRIDDVG